MLRAERAASPAWKCEVSSPRVELLRLEPFRQIRVGPAEKIKAKITSSNVIKGKLRMGG